MNLFGKRRIAQLKKDNKDLQKIAHDARNQCDTLRNQVEYLVRTIRDMDQEIYNMGQKDSWASQRSHFVKLHDEMTARKVAESKRIGDLLRGELIDTYAPNITKAIGES